MYVDECASRQCLDPARKYETMRTGVLRFAAGCQDRRITATRCQYRTKLTVHADHPVRRFVFKKQTCLRIAVVLHAAVIIDVITAEIRKQGDIEVHAVDTVLAQAVRRNLHRDVRGAIIPEPGQLAMHLDTVGGRQAGGGINFTDPGTECAEIGGGPSQSLQALREQIRNGRLAIGAGDTDDPHASGRQVEPAIGDDPEPVRKPFNRDGSDSVRRVKAAPFVRFPDDGRDLPRECFAHIIEAVRARAATRKENVAGTEPATVTCNAGDRKRRRRCHTFQ